MQNLKKLQLLRQLALVEEVGIGAPVAKVVTVRVTAVTVGKGVKG